MGLRGGGNEGAVVGLGWGVWWGCGWSKVRHGWH